MRKPPKMLNDIDRQSKLDDIAARKEHRRITKESERTRLLAVKAAGMAPDGVGPDVQFISPARGATVEFTPVVRMSDGKDGYKYVAHGYRGRKAMRERDVFDEMKSRAERRKAKFALNEQQIATGRYLRTLHEYVNQSGHKLSSLEGGNGGSDRGADFMDRYLARVQDYNWMTARIGVDIVLDVNAAKGARPYRNIDEHDVVFSVCIGQLTPSLVLEHNGWTNTTKRRVVIIEALMVALDAMSDIGIH